MKLLNVGVTGLTYYVGKPVKIVSNSVKCWQDFTAKKKSDKTAVSSAALQSKRGVKATDFRVQGPRRWRQQLF